MLIAIVFQNAFQPRVEYSFVSNLLLMSTIPFACARVRFFKRNPISIIQIQIR